MNPRKMQQMMKKMGIQQSDLDAKEVIIKLEDKELVFTNPSVAKVNMMGQETYQIVGTPEERELETKPEITDEDVQTVIDQTGASKDLAQKVLEKNEGDIAQSIVDIKERKY
ncbi:nascent polypeptide-associated complex protein [Candidatus Woesearchaeota archaeon]|nr:nascent polypeptide-associated complex protein [Candidatus Woesearchaeota archaeon]